MDSAMSPDYVAVGINDRPFTVGIGRVTVDKGRVIVIRDETDLLTIWLVRDRQPSTASEVAHRVLRPVSDRKHRPRELVLRQREQKVGLVLRRVGRAAKLISS